MEAKADITPPGQLTLGSALAGRWQVPLLAVSVLLLAGAIGQMVANYHPPTFGEQLERIERLRAADALGRASAFMMHLLEDRSWTREERGHLQRLLASTIHQAESPLVTHRRENVHAVITNYRGAMRLGAKLDGDDWIALGDAYVWAADESEAIAAYRSALGETASHPARVRRTFVELLRRHEGRVTEEAKGQLTALLATPSTPPQEYLWAAEQTVHAALDAGDTAAAVCTTSAARERLRGSEAAPAVTYLEALVKWKSGMSAEAEATARALQDQWKARDELWAKSAWLLGRLEQEDGRPQAALSYYDDILSSFFSGEPHDASILGKAECLAALQQYDAALEWFGRLRPILACAPRGGLVDRPAVRSTVSTIADALAREGRPAASIGFTRLALEWADPSDSKLNTYLLTRLCENLEAVARGCSPADATEARAAWREAGEIQMTLARRAEGDEDAAAQAVERAARSFDAANDPERLINLLNWYAAMHPSGLWRCSALNRLGHVYQQEGRYDEAIDAYREVVRLCARLPDATECMVPLAECLLRGGGMREKAGVEVLLDIVEDRAPGFVFSPQMREYRDATFLLGEHYSSFSDRPALEKAILRLEDALAFYPDDPRALRAEFLLADAYRRTANLLVEESGNMAGADQRAAAEAEARRRCGLALDRYGRVIAAMGEHDAATLSPLEIAMLRTSYLYRGDCLFGLDRLTEAVAAYREAVWRFENTLTAVTASMQIVHAHLRRGESTEAAATLARLRWLLAKMPESVFAQGEGAPPKAYWQNLVSQMERTGLN